MRHSFRNLTHFTSALGCHFNKLATSHTEARRAKDSVRQREFGCNMLRLVIPLLLVALTLSPVASASLVLSELFGASGRVIASKVTHTGTDAAAYGYEPNWNVQELLERSFRAL